MRKITLLLTAIIYGSLAMAQLPENSFFEFEFTNGSLANLSASGAPDFTGSVSPVTDRNGNANDAADITGPLSGASVGAANVNEMTLSFWMKHGPISSNERIVQIYGTGGKGFRLQMDGAQLLYNANVGGASSSYVSRIEGEVVNIDDNVWHHIVVRTTQIDVQKIEFDVFLDNVPLSTLSNTQLDIEDFGFNYVITNFLSNATLAVSPTNNYSGDIDDIYFYKSALTDAQVAQLYNHFPGQCNVDIPDATFKSILVANSLINTNSDTEIQCSEASAYTGTIDVNSYGITDLTGIEAFTALTRLICDGNQIPSLDLTTNVALTYLYCAYNPLTSLNVANGNNSNFTEFDATFCPNLSCITVDDVAYSTTNWTDIDAGTSFSLDCNAPPCTVTIPDANFKAYLVGNTNINTNGDTEIQCSEASAFAGAIQCNSSSIADLTGIEAFTALTELSCSSNSLTSLDVSASVNLETLHCSNNSLTGLDVSQNVALTTLVCTSNPVVNLDVTQNTGLTYLDCGFAGLNSLDVSQNTALTYLDLPGNPLTGIDVTQNTALTTLKVYYGSLASIDVTQNTLLTTLWLQENSLTALDISQNLALENLSCRDNSLTSLDVSQHTALAALWCSSNALTVLNVANGNNSNFTNFVADNNPNLTCIEVDDVAYSTSNWLSVDATASYSTNCSTVGVNEAANQNVSIYPNPAKNQLFVQLDEQVLGLDILELSGKVVKTMANISTNSIDVSELSQGIYVLRAQTETGVATTRFIKQ